MPRRTAELLDKLSALGFSDSDFRVLHHQSYATVRLMTDYCSTIDDFQPDGTNQRVRERLELVLAAFLGANFSKPAKTGVMALLAQAAVKEIPK